jgi:hypothetical protein
MCDRASLSGLSALPAEKSKGTHAPRKEKARSLSPALLVYLLALSQAITVSGELSP